MDSFSNGYSSLNHVAVTRHENYAWWWRLISIISSFSILGGFLSLQPLFEQNPKLNLSPIGVIILAVALLTAGFSLTALLCFACRDPRYQLDVILTPGLLSTFTGLLSILYNLAISSRYEWKVASIIGTCIGAVGSITYTILAMLAHRRQTQTATRPSSQPGERIKRLLGRPARVESVKNPIITILPGEAPVQILAGEPSEEEESTRQQMLGLLKVRGNALGRSSDNSLRSTYNIEMPSIPNKASQNRISMPPHVRDYYSPLSNNQAPRQVPATRARGPSDAATSMEPTPEETLIGIQNEVVVSAPAPAEHLRSRSRDDRRLEIELAEERARSNGRELRRKQIELGQTP